MRHAEAPGRQRARRARNDANRPVILRYRLTSREYARASLVQHYRARRWGPFRAIGGPLLIGIGLLLHQLAGGDDRTRGLGMFFVFYGLYYALRPFLTTWLRLRMRARDGIADDETELALDEDGLRIGDPHARSNLDWDAVEAAGEADDHFFIAVRGSVRFVVPRRVVTDVAAFREPFERRGKWQTR
jgi:hypothetical protein